MISLDHLHTIHVFLPGYFYKKHYFLKAWLQSANSFIISVYREIVKSLKSFFRSSYQRCSIKKLFLKISQYHGKTTPTEVFSYEYCKIFKNIYFEEYLRASTFESYHLNRWKFQTDDYWVNPSSTYDRDFWEHIHWLDKQRCIQNPQAATGGVL